MGKLINRLIETALKEDDSFKLYSEPFPIEEINEVIEIINATSKELVASFVIDNNFFDSSINYGGRLVVRKTREAKEREWKLKREQKEKEAVK